MLGNQRGGVSFGAAPLRWVVARALALLSGQIVRARVQSPAVDNFLQTMCVKMQQVHHWPQTRMDARFPIMCEKVIHIAQ